MAGATVPLAIRRAGDDRLGSALYFLRRNPRMIVGGIIVLGWLIVAGFAPFLAPYDPIKVNVSDSLIPPGPAHWLGIRDDKGRIIVAITFQSDIGDSWEWADAPYYPEYYSRLGIRIGVNYIEYAMTH